ncbi:hypothetical protein RRG08_000440 [Elysia crispata]|uniref:Uncharacterized protein n=1 Tax=Elysia crispata TaxID=231223 RepID=A0AAE1CWT6_9GAST|nr:hypothetical protein RRG08_000440 [Elysia crispata]
MDSIGSEGRKSAGTTRITSTPKFEFTRLRHYILRTACQANTLHTDDARKQFGPATLVIKLSVQKPIKPHSIQDKQTHTNKQPTKRTNSGENQALCSKIPWQSVLLTVLNYHGGRDGDARGETKGSQRDEK